MGFFLRDLHQQIKHLHLNSLTEEKPTTVYRGQGMFKDDFEKMISSKGGLLSFNNFLSTSDDSAVSFAFAESAKDDPNLTGILFQITIAPELLSTPSVLLDNISCFSDQEKEILFSMHTVFRIGEMKQIEDRFWHVHLTLTGNDDEQLTRLTEYIREEIGGGTGLHQLGHVLIKIGQLGHAEKVYNTLFDSMADNDPEDIAHIYYQLGYIKGGGPHPPVL
jgi:hypothetical protein